MQPDAVRHGRKRPLVEPGPATIGVCLGRSAIEHILPHRDPFLFIDTITAVDLQQRAVWARRRIVPDDPVFVGHFPEHPGLSGRPANRGYGAGRTLLAVLLSDRRAGRASRPASAQRARTQSA